MPWSVAIMVISIISIVTIGRIVREFARARAQGPGEPSAELIAGRDEVRQLKERVAVLERLVTENHGSLGLDREIERLRDR